MTDLEPIMKLDYPFATNETPELGQVGGKAVSLILLTRRGLPVPPGFVLTVAFFQPWLEHFSEPLNGPVF